MLCVVPPTPTKKRATSGSILVWNCRGIVNTETQRALIDLVHAKKPCLIFLSETLARKELINSLTHRIGFHDNICFDCQEGSQGVALIWYNETHVDLRSASAHHIDAVIGKPSEELWRFTGLYGWADRGQREYTWQLIQQLAGENCQLAWLMDGDYNEVMSSADKSGGPPRSAAAMARFRHTMAQYGLIDMGFTGCRFTWSNKFTKERLDRGFQSPLWRARFPFSRVITMSPSESDHCPLLIEVNAENRSTRVW